MRLLFIYFYDDFGTFEKGSIIHLSKKYKFTLDKEKSTENEFYFNKEENPNFIEDFYSKNIDIGVLIGENGTGKSVLLNSIRDKKNEYSICVYEEENGFYCFSNQKEIFIENQKIIERKLNYIYYTSLIDAFDNDTDDTYNISNRAFLKKYDGKNLDIKLNLIENDDIQKFFNMDYAINYNVKIESLEIKYDKFFFNILRKNFSEKYFNLVYGVFIRKIIEKISFSFKDKNSYEYKILEIVEKGLDEKELIRCIDTNIDFYLFYDELFLKNVFRITKSILTKQLDKDFRAKIKQISFSFESDEVKDSFSDFIVSNFIDINILKVNKVDYFNLFYINNIVEHFESIFSKYVNVNNPFNVGFLGSDIFYYVEGNDIHDFYVKYELYNEFIEFLLDYYNYDEKKTRRQLKDFLSYQYINSFLKNNLGINRKNNINLNMSRKLTYLKLEFDLFHENYESFYQINENEKKQIVKLVDDDYIEQIYFEVTDINIKKDLLILYLEKEYTESESKILIIGKIISIIESEDSIFQNQRIFEINKNNFFTYESFINSFIASDKIKANNNFFEFYKKLIGYELKPFIYNLNPPLSSGQKAILFIFARINDAIQKIKIEKPNENILILLDEADLKLHLEWQRQFLFDLIEFLNSYSNNKFYVLYATHSPMILSDITNDRVVFLKKKDEKYSEDKQDFTKNTFGANIYDIYADSFFVDDFMGKFAQNKINGVIDLIESHKKDKQTISKNQVPNLLKIVKNIGEPLLRNKLEDDIKFLFDIKDDISQIADTLKDKNFEEIKQELNKYSQDKQKEILEKLFGNQND